MLKQLSAIPAIALGTCLAVSGTAGAAAPDSPAAGSRDAQNSVVKVFATISAPDLSRPWSKQPPAEVTASGVVIDGKRILTNAHVVKYASQVQIQANQAGDKVSAAVAAVAAGMDLAVLKLDDESFFDSHPPLPRATTLPQIKDPVLAYGFPTGGSSLSITKGIVSRIEFVPYQFGAFGLRIQIDAAINPGNSGGPAVAGGRMIGLAFSHLSNSENIGYIIPEEEIELFLRQVAAGGYTGKPALRDEFQTLENPALRTFLKLEGSVHGLVVRRTHATEAPSVLRQWDVLTHIADVPIDDQGMIQIEPGDLRLSAGYMVQKKAHNGTVPITIVRAGRTLHVEEPTPVQYPLMLGALEGAYPRYFIYGPLVFETATQDFLGTHAKDLGGFMFATGSPLMTMWGEPPQPERGELVMVPAPLFPHRISKGYSSPAGSVVKSVNGTAIRSLDHLVALLRDLKDEFVTIEFDGRLGEALVFRREEMLAATEQILTDNGIRAQGSPDLMKIWQAK
ncbi:MAG TPA: trypsin-like peptidase domain-containing protein [Steroidobacteraceae bacterium]|nr:trypsin-like peptidase domain-containing protein [Steroidobacteraceae bacterium]